MEHRFEVLCKDRTGRDIRRDRVVQESLITVDGKSFCSCTKPKLLHLPCSHLIAACAESRLQPGVFVSHYFSKEATVSTWGHEVYEIGIVWPFIQDNENKMFIPDPATKKGKGRRQTRRIPRDKSIAANVEHWVTTTRSVPRMHFTMLLTSVLPEIPEMEHLLRSGDDWRELLVEGFGVMIHKCIEHICNM